LDRRKPEACIYYYPTYPRYRHRPYVTPTNARWHLGRVVLFVLIAADAGAWDTAQ